MIRRRSRTEMYVDTLRAIQKERMLTRIMALANLTWRQFQDEIHPLIKAGLIVEQPADNPNDKKQKYVYRITKKGAEMIAAQDIVDRCLNMCH